MSPTLEPSPLHREHHRTASLHTLTTPSSPPSSRPSTASTQSSFRTAHTTLASPYNYYLPHISTADDAVYTRNAAYSCNFPPGTAFRALPPVHYGRLYAYVPALSGEEEDVYTDGVNVVYDTLRGPGQLHIRPEQKVIGGFREVRYGESSSDASSQGSGFGRKESTVAQEICVTEAVDVDVGGRAGGERFGCAVDVSAGAVQGEKKESVVRREKHRRSVSLAGMSEKVKEMLRRMHIGRKAGK